MGIKQLLLIVGCVGCGQVVTSGHDAAIAIDAAPDAFACTGTQMACGTSCFDLMTDNAHCGTCTNACLSNQGCAVGSCIDATASCANIHTLNPNAASGPYTHTADNTQFFCDMSKMPPVQYDALGMGRYNGTWPGYSIIDAAQLTDPVIQQAFIWAFNKQGGMPAFETWLPVNVCATASLAGGSRLMFGGNLLFPSQGTTQTSSLTVNMLYGQELISNAVFMTPPLASNFFTTYPPSEGAGCSDGNNPAFWFKKH